jgi:hypothetical protein
MITDLRWHYSVNKQILQKSRILFPATLHAAAISSPELSQSICGRAVHSLTTEATHQTNGHTTITILDIIRRPVFYLKLN